MTMRILLFVVALCVLGLFLPTAAAESPPPFVVVVHPKNPATSVNRKFLGDAFLKKATRWPNDDVIRPVDQAPDSAVRRRFTEDVLKRSVAAVRSYWQQIIFSGRDLPPPELASDEDVVRFVAKHEGGIGYVGADAVLSGVKAIRVE